MERGFSPSRNLRVAAASYFLSEANTIRKNRSLVAKAKRGTLNTGMIGHGQAIQRQHAEHRRNRAEQNRHLERDHDERRPGIERPAADIGRVADHRHPILHQVAAGPADDSADQGDQRHQIVMESDGLGQSFHRERAVGVDLLVAGFAGAVGRRHQIAGRIELRHHSVDGSVLHSGFTSASGSRVRISKIEIIGRMRTNRNMQARKTSQWFR